MTTLTSPLLSLLPLLLVAACAPQGPTTDAPSDLVTVTVFATANAGRLAADWSPDGKWITYNHEGDIWIEPVDGGEAIQVTEDPARDRIPRWSPEGSRILFLSDRDGAENLWTISPFEGEETAALVTTAADSVMVEGLVSDWSPDGAEIVFVSHSGGRNSRWDLRIIPASGGASRILPGLGKQSWDPAWSPDGKWIAFNGPDADSGADLWITSVSGDSLRQLTTESLGDYNPHWSPDGKWIVFASFRSNRWDLWMVPAAGGTPVQITDSPSTDVGPRWSPDGKQVVFAATPGQAELWLVDASGGDPSRLLETVDSFSSPGWSPDGREIAFALRDVGGGKDLWKVSSSGGDPVRLTEGGVVSRRWDHVRWSPDGSRVAFGSEKAENGDVWTVPAAGGSARRVTIASEDDGMMSWSPDGNQIAYTSGIGGGDGTSGSCLLLADQPKSWWTGRRSNGVRTGHRRATGSLLSPGGAKLEKKAVIGISGPCQSPAVRPHG